jgi:hypothetical protein
MLEQAASLKKLRSPNFSHVWDLLVPDVPRQKIHHFRETSCSPEKFAHYKRVYFFEAPILGASKVPICIKEKSPDGIIIIHPYLSGNLSVFEQKDALIALLKKNTIR